MSCITCVRKAQFHRNINKSFNIRRVLTSMLRMYPCVIWCWEYTLVQWRCSKMVTSATPPSHHRKAKTVNTRSISYLIHCCSTNYVALSIIIIAFVTTEPSDEGNLSLGFIQLRTHQHLHRNTTNAWFIVLFLFFVALCSSWAM